MSSNGASAAMPEPTTAPALSEGRRTSGIRAQLASTAASEAVTFVAAIAVSVIVNRALQPEGKGLLSATINVVNIAFMVSSFSLSKSFLYFFNRGRASKSLVMGAALCFWPIGAVLGAFVLGIAAWRGSIGSTPLLLALSAALLLTQQAQDILYGSLRAVRAIHSLNVAKITQQCIRLLLVAGLARAALLTFPVALATELAAQLCAMAIVVQVFFGRRELYPAFRGATGPMRQILSYGLLYQLFSIVWMLHLKLDVLLLKAWAGAEQTGLYSTAVNLADLISRLPTLLLFVTSPYMAQLRTDKESLAYATRVCRMALPVLVLGAIVMAAAAPLLVVFLYGESYARAAVPLRIILPGTICAGMFMVVVSHLVVKGYFKPLLILQSIGLALNIGLNSILIPRHAAAGAALASVFSYAFCLVGVVTYLCRYQQMRWQDMVVPRADELKAIVMRRARRA